LIVGGVSAAIELRVVAVVGCVVSVDVVARVVAVRRRPMRIARALLVVLADAAAFSHVVVATAVQKVTAETRLALRCVARRRVVFIALAVDEILADS